MVGFRPLSGLCLFRLVAAWAPVWDEVEFPSPIGVMSIQTRKRWVTISSISLSFRPLSGLCLFRRNYPIKEKLGYKFPSPIGVMSIQTLMYSSISSPRMSFRPLSGLCLFRLYEQV